MGRIQFGSLGPINGKVGNLVISSWKGKPYVKSAPGERTVPPTPKEMANRKKWAMAHAWLKPVTEFVREGFKGYSDTIEGFIAAKSYLLKNAFEGSAPELTINPALVKVSFGELSLPQHINVTLNTNKELQFTWDANDIEFANRYDQVMLLAYDIEGGYAYTRLAGQLRMNGSDTVNVQRGLNRTLHVYIAFVSANRLTRSNSLYLGPIFIE
ncbi:DUF6266 family protein [Niastella sp. OAS944]|uniref:DUF6266 family protein n=1 Tax=Niastella sp. OAS944 TaxID=2664089 RepID=UPI00348B71D4|nr:hypothetical protein [Chitinophagaceae bacterium OAS944]